MANLKQTTTAKPGHGHDASRQHAPVRLTGGLVANRGPQESTACSDQASATAAGAAPTISIRHKRVWQA
jgi:hypothetical protein